jgi:hemolysin activation/secretion protein
MIRFSAIKLSRLLLVAPFCWLAQGQALAQSVALPSEADISRLRLSPPDLPSQEDLNLTIRSPEKSVVPKDVSVLDFMVSRVQVNGVTYFSDERVQSLFAHLEGQTIRLDALREQADHLQALYANEGFLLTRVIIPPQTIDNGVVTIEVVEGYIDEISLEDEGSIGGRLAQNALSGLQNKRPLNIRELDGKLLILNDTPGVSAKTLLQPGSERGAARMAVSTARVPNQGFVSVSNTGSNAIGPALYSVGYTLNSPLNRPGAIDLSVSVAGRNFEELQALSARYAFPVGSKGAVVYFGGLAAKAKPGGEASELDVSSASYSSEVRLRSPLHRSRSSTLYIETALLFAQTRVDALGAEITRDKIAISQVGLRGQHQSSLGRTTAQLFVTAGLPVFGALNQDTPNPSVAGFDPNFGKINWQLEHIAPVNTRLSIFTRMVGQWTNDRLLAGEQVAFGGQILGRGYSPSALTGDRGLGLLGELRLDLPEADNPGMISNVQAYGFADAASAKLLAGRDTPSEKQNIQSYGIGMKAFVLDRLFLDLQFAFEGKTLAGGESRPTRVNISIVSVF